MVSSVTGSTYTSYLNQIQGNATTATTSQSNSQSLVSSLLSNNNAYTPSVVSLLQPTASGNFDPIASLLGGASTDTGVTSLYSNLYASVAASTLTQAQALGNAQAQQSATPANPLDSLINQLTQASVAYNQTVQQNAQAVLAANSYGPDGVTKLVA